MTGRRTRRARQMLPRAFRSAGERREYVVAFGMVALLQAAIAVSLAVCARQTYRMWRQGIPYIPGELGKPLPWLLLGAAAIALLAALRSLARIRAARRVPLEPGNPDTAG